MFGKVMVYSVVYRDGIREGGLRRYMPRKR